MAVSCRKRLLAITKDVVALRLTAERMLRRTKYATQAYIMLARDLASD
jgi:hypothetical protein